MSDEHSTVDGTLIQAWASQKSFRLKGGSDDGDGGDIRGQKRSNKTHESSADADARLYKKSYGKELMLSYLSRRWLIEKGFGWLKQTGPLRQVEMHRLEKVDWLFVFSCEAHNLIRLPKLMAQPTPARLRAQCA
jgi:hypothetical protein